MKAAVIHQFGDFDVLKVEDIATPKPKPGNVLVKILAAGVNRLDHYLREGSVVPDFPFPHILGADAAGEVFRPGKGVTDFEIGDRVIVVPGYPQNEEDYDIYPGSQAPSFGLPGLDIPGTYAQYIEVPARFLLKDETGLTAAEAATLPVALATAVRAVKEVAGAKAGDSVLVQAGPSGSGSMQIQVAKALGARVATTIRNESKADIVREIGADLVINTNDDDVVERVKEWTDGRGADVVIDNLAGDVFATSIAAAKATGVIIAFGFAAGPEVKFDIRSLFFEQKEIKGSMASDKRDMEFGLQLVREGRIRPLLDRTLPLSEAAQAHRLVANNEVTGSIALLPWAA